MNQRRFKIGDEVFTMSGAVGRVIEAHTAIVDEETIYEVSLGDGAGIAFIRESQLGSYAKTEKRGMQKGWVRYDA